MLAVGRCALCCSILTVALVLAEDVGKSVENEGNLEETVEQRPKILISLPVTLAVASLVNRQYQTSRPLYENESSENSTSIYQVAEEGLVNDFDAYSAQRNELVEKEMKDLTGGNLLLAKNESRANDIVMSAKFIDYDQGVINASIYPPSLPFHLAKPLIEKSQLFKLIKRMPKGANIYTFLPGMVSAEFLYGLTLRDNLYFCADAEHGVIFRFSKNKPDGKCAWKLMKEMRETNSQTSEFENWVRSLFTVNVYRPNLEETTKTVVSLITYRPVFEDFLTQVFQELLDDNIMYAEIRDRIPAVYEIDGHAHTKTSTLSIFEKSLKKFTDRNKDFIGARIIYTEPRSSSKKQVENYLTVAEQLKDIFGELISGFDLTMEDHLFQYPLNYYAADFLKHKNSVTYWLTAGDTKNLGSVQDHDLIDAIMLKSKIIAGAHTLSKHPQWMERARLYGMGVVFSPIRDQTLLVPDLRSHPHSTLITRDYPVVIGSSHPGLWGATGLSYDWYQAFLGMTPRQSDIRTLKQWALNSIVMNSLSEDDQLKAYVLWEKKWKEFIEFVEKNENNS